MNQAANVTLLPGISDPGKPIGSQPNIDCVMKLEQVLEMAKAGIVTDVAIAFCTDDDVGQVFNADCTHDLLGCVGILELRIKHFLILDSTPLPVMPVA